MDSLFLNSAVSNILRNKLLAPFKSKLCSPSEKAFAVAREFQ